MNLELIRFEEQNVVLAENQPQYLDLPAHVKNNDHGELIFCWKMRPIYRIKFLFSGKLWHSVLTFNNALQPQKMSTIKPLMTKGIVE